MTNRALSEERSSIFKGNANFKFFSVSEVARMLRLSRNTITAALGDIPGVVRLSERSIRIPEAGLRAWLRKLEMNP